MDFLDKLTSSTRRASSFSARANDRDLGHGGLGGSGGGEGGTTPSQIILWPGRWTQKTFRSVGYQQPRFHDSDQRAVVANFFEGKEGEAQKISAEPPEVPPPTCTTGGTGWGHTTLWEAEGGVQRDGSEDAAMERLDFGRDFAAIAHRAMLRRAGRLCQTGGRRLHRQIGAALCNNWRDQTACVGESIVTKLAGGNVQEAFRHLKGWYRAALEMQSKPHDGTSDFGASQLVCAEAVPRGPPPTASHSS
jgi:hypothetical protein